MNFEGIKKANRFLVANFFSCSRDRLKYVLFLDNRFKSFQNCSSISPKYKRKILPNLRRAKLLKLSQKVDSFLFGYAKAGGELVDVRRSIADTFYAGVHLPQLFVKPVSFVYCSSQHRAEQRQAKAQPTASKASKNTAGKATSGRPSALTKQEGECTTDQAFASRPHDRRLPLPPSRNLTKALLAKAGWVEDASGNPLLWCHCADWLAASCGSFFRSINEKLLPALLRLEHWRSETIRLTSSVLKEDLP